MSIKGIDVSSYQGDIDWNKVKKSGIEFAIIRAGYGKNTTDDCFVKNIKGAIAQGIKVGVYWFLYVKSKADVELNAQKCIEVIKPYKNDITMKVWADWEYDSDRYCPNLTDEERTDYTKTFCSLIAKAGFEPGIYANPDYICNKFTNITGYPLWLAWYGVSEESAKKYDPWCYQYSSEGKVDGVSGKVDMDIWYASVQNNTNNAVTTTTTATTTTTTNNVNNKVLEWQKAAIKDGFTFLKYGADGKWGSECEEVAKKAIVKKRSTYLYPNLTKIVQKAVGVIIDGMFGVKSWQKTMEYQEANGLVVDGCVGINTWKKILGV